MNGSISEEALLKYNQLVAEKQGLDFAEGDSYDFTTCIRPDGSAYGTSGKCRKGTEGEAKKENKGVPVLTKGDMKGMSEAELRSVKKQMDERAFGKGGAPLSNEKLQAMSEQNKAINEELARRGGSAPVAPVPPKSAMTKKDPVASVLRSQQELRDFHKRENERLAEMIKAGKVKGVTSADLDRIKANRNRG